MKDNGPQRVALLEEHAERLAVFQLDLLAQVEHQLRAIHGTMRHIEKLRRPELRVGPELSAASRKTTLASLDSDIAALEAQLGLESECCAEMHLTIEKMQRCVTTLRRRSSEVNADECNQPEVRATSSTLSGSRDGRDVVFIEDHADKEPKKR